MTCAQCESRIQELLDGGGTIGVDPDVSAHIRECGACRSFMETTVSLDAMLRRASRQQPSSELMASLRAIAYVPTHTESSHSVIRRLIGWAAFGIAAVLGIQLFPAFSETIWLLLAVTGVSYCVRMILLPRFVRLLPSP
jgi:predicted anti-sigma-YlaC factor YlaD